MTDLEQRTGLAQFWFSTLDSYTLSTPEKILEPIWKIVRLRDGERGFLAARQGRQEALVEPFAARDLRGEHPVCDPLDRRAIVGPSRAPGCEPREAAAEEWRK